MSNSTDEAQVSDDVHLTSLSSKKSAPIISLQCLFPDLSLPIHIHVGVLIELLMLDGVYVQGITQYINCTWFLSSFFLNLRGCSVSMHLFFILFKLLCLILQCKSAMVYLIFPISLNGLLFCMCVGILKKHSHICTETCRRLAIFSK